MSCRLLLPARPLRPAAASAPPCLCAKRPPADQSGPPARRRGQPPEQQQRRRQSAAAGGLRPAPRASASAPPPPLPRLLAGAAAAASALLAPLLPSWAAESLDFDYLAGADAGIDPALADAPDLLNTLLVVVVTYFTVLLVFLWLSSVLEEDADGPLGPGASGGRAPPDQSEGGSAPGPYGPFLGAHVRSYVDPHGAGGQRQVRKLQALDQALPLEGESLDQLKGRLAAGAAEALDEQIRDCERLVRTKLLSRKLGYVPSRSAGAAQPGQAVAQQGQGQQQQQQQQADLARIGAMLADAVSAPGGLGSWQHRAAIDSLIETQLDQLLPPDGRAVHEDVVVRQVMRVVVRHLVMEESLLLLEGVEQGKRALEASARAGKKFALW